MSYSLQYEMYGDEGENLAPYCRLAVCEEHGLERVDGERTISTGYDQCDVGVFPCGRIVMEDVF